MKEHRVFHVTNWYPNPWDNVEGNFVRAQYNVFRQSTCARLVNVQVRTEKSAWLRLKQTAPSDHERGYFILTRFERSRIHELLTTLLLIGVLVRERAWRYDLLHFHIAWPLLAHAHIWRRIFRMPIVVSEHWSAYHFNFGLPENAASLNRIRRVFRLGIPVIAVSNALLEDVRRFAKTADFDGYVIPNVVPLQSPQITCNPIPVLFSVNVWRPIKEPLQLLRGLARAADDGAAFKLVIGGFGELAEDMQLFVTSTSLASRTRILGKLTKAEIATQLGKSDGYLFSSQYETFSVACAEALGAGVPLIGPLLPAVAEYAGPGDWEQIEKRDADGWSNAIIRFLTRMQSGDFDRYAIAARASKHFSNHYIRQVYLDKVLPEVGLTNHTPLAARRDRQE